MKTYAEENGEKPFDWNRELDLKIQDPNSGLSDAYLEGLAGTWVTCACGNMCDIIPRDVDQGYPLDYQLRKLGLRFTENIDQREWNQAKATLSMIEERSEEIIKQLSLTR